MLWCGYYRDVHTAELGTCKGGNDAVVLVRDEFEYAISLSDAEKMLTHDA
jgi:CYTH domain-containing protein